MRRSNYRRPIDKNREDTYLAKDSIRPYGERYERSSESERKKVLLMLAGKKDSIGEIKMPFGD